MRNLFIIFILLFIPLFTGAQTVLFPNRGGTGTTIIPTIGQILMGQSNGTYIPVATSSLGIIGGSGGGITSLNAQTGSSQTFASSTAGTDFKITSASNVHTFQLPTASALARGLLSVADWLTFNQKVSSTSIDTSAELDTLVTDDTGSGALVFGTSPTITTPTIAKLANLTSNGFVKTSGGDGTLSVDTSTYLTGNQTITLSGDVSGSGATAITTTVADNSHNHTSTTVSGLDISDDTNLSVTATGLTLSGDAIAGAAGYSIPKTASTTEWHTAYGLRHAAVTLSGALDYITLTGQDIVRGAIDLATDITGVLADDNGGTGQSTYATGDLLYASGANTLAKLSIGSPGTVLKVSGGVPAWGTDNTGGGAGGSGTISTSTTPVLGQLSYWTGPSTLGTVATGTLSESVLGLEFSASRSLVGGAAALSLTSGYGIPLTASTSAWQTFYTTPSNRITAATGIDWTGNTLNVTLGDFTTTNLGEGSNLYYTDARSRAAISENVVGLSYNSGTGVLGTTTGYTIPLAASTTDWHTFRTTPSSRITAGTGLSWAGNTLNSHVAVTLSGALDYITLSGQDIIRGAIDLATDVTGALGIANGGLGAAFTDPNADRLMFWDDSAGFITGISTLTNLAISGTTLAIDLASSFAWTGNHDFGGATGLEIPNGASPTVNATGEFAFDTTDNQFLIATGTSARAIPTITKLWGGTVASSSLDYASGGRIPLPPHRDGVVVTEVHCFVDGGTSKVINLDTIGGGAQLDSLTCGTTLTSDTAQSANNALSAGTRMALEFGATTGSVDYVTFSAWGYIVPE